MSKFKKRISNMSNTTTTKPINPTVIFKHLTPPEEGYGYLRDVQTEFLDNWSGVRGRRDIVGKLNTGAGKTLIALLMLKSKLNEGYGPAVYLCPDRQLVKQAVEQADIFNIPVKTIQYSSNERAEFPIEFLNGEAILICTFERLFNGRSIFGVGGYYTREIQEIGTLVVDDAHSCIKKARQQSTITIPNTYDAYSKIFSLFEDDLHQQGAGLLASIKAGESSISQMIPYWSWHKQRTTIINILGELLKEEDPAVLYSWGIIGDELNQCECYISSSSIEITPMKLPIQQIPSFHQAKHRFFLSATFSDDSKLLNELGVDRSAIENPIEPEDKGDVGERLIITPKRYHMELEDYRMRAFIADYARDQNVVVIVPNMEKSKMWEKFHAKVVTKDNINDATERLKSSVGNLMIFVARYDGIDLAGDACRVLVLDGMPTATTNRDKHHQIVRQDSPIFNAQVAETIEQGLGRAVRSGSDFCNVFILDNALIKFMFNKNNQPFFAPETLAQIKFGQTIFDGEQPETSEEALEEVKSATESVLNRDPEWRSFHKQLILDVNKDHMEQNSFLLNLAENFSKAVDLFIDEKYEAGTNEFLTYIDQHKELLSDIDKAWYTQVAASFIYPVNSSRANDLQVKAKNQYRRVLKPLTPNYSKLTRSRGKQSEIIKKWLENYGDGSDVYIAIEDMITNFRFSPDIVYHVFEKAVHDIGSFLGFGSAQPETDENDGPDNLWIPEGDENVLIEAKSQSIADKIPRGDVGQLLHSIEWYKQRYGAKQECIPIIIHPSNKTEDNAHPPENARVMDMNKLNEFRQSLLAFGKALSSKTPSTWTEKEIHQQLVEHNLHEGNLFKKYTKELK
ncbi:DEAD/DEAH box helicase [Salicibibacter cibarius]|uniref:DEAD/DEAH box helicase n=1 Tax=Salicibibacter cibarius TaxID=2743000 RepID=A0A7T6Z538_9BACI|nr:DEAD/DEAH box helicase [Salicibibacter cibarius]QQK76541.1 DEAD/DEAH box helicase [Salicibibacter cibarius]